MFQSETASPGRKPAASTSHSSIPILPSLYFKSARVSPPETFCALYNPYRKHRPAAGTVQPHSEQCRFLAKVFHHRLAGMRTQVVHHRRGCCRPWITGGVQKIIRKLRRRAAGRHLGKMPSCLRRPNLEDITRTLRPANRNQRVISNTVPSREPP